jgi:ATP/maltotriose-dependent transcriptional regulator MalT
VPDWLAVHADLCAADRDHGLPPEDLEHLAVAAFLLGREGDVVPLRERALQLYLGRGEVDRAVRCGFWCGYHLQTRGELAQAQGWERRLTRLVGDRMSSTFEGMAMQAMAARMMVGGDGAGALPLFERGAEIAAKEDDLDLFTLAGLGRGRCLQLTGRDDESAAALDEVMVHVVAGRVAPQVIGFAYCSVIEMCMGRFDLARAREWTAALGGWVDEQLGMVPYRGTCLVHRAEILQLQGAWPDASRQAEQAFGHLVRSEQALAAAHYRSAELARLRGRLDVAEAAYARAASHGYEVQPGLALLRLAQSRPDAAMAGLRRALDEPTRDPRGRPLQLAAQVEIGLATGDRASARAAAADLAALVGPQPPPFLAALLEHAAGATLLADGDAHGALARLRRAGTLWRELEVPYEAARTRLLVADACAALGDRDAAAMETAAAQATLAHLGAATACPDPAGPLSPRECEVLRLVATGVTNRVIAHRLVLSEKTVARHVSNILAKLGLASRAAATAWAFEHGLV